MSTPDRDHALIGNILDLYEERERDSNNDSDERVLPSANGMARVDGNFDVAGRGRDESAVDGLVRVAVQQKSACLR